MGFFIQYSSILGNPVCMCMWLCLYGCTKYVYREISSTPPFSWSHQLPVGHCQLPPVCLLVQHQVLRLPHWMPSCSLVLSNSGTCYGHTMFNKVIAVQLKGLTVVVPGWAVTVLNINSTHSVNMLPGNRTKVNTWQELLSNQCDKSLVLVTDHAQTCVASYPVLHHCYCCLQYEKRYSYCKQRQLQWTGNEARLVYTVCFGFYMKNTHSVNMLPGNRVAQLPL